MMKNKLFIAFIIAFILTACVKHYTYKSSYVGYYYVPEFLKVDVAGKSPNFKISILFDSYTDYSVMSVGEEKETYNKYAEYYGDTNFMRDDDDHGGPYVSCNPLALITVTCNQDWDANHPAGTPLDDLIAASVQSVKKQIESNYKETNNFFYYSKLTDIDYIELRPFSHIIYLYMPSSVDKHGKYEFTITVGFDQDPITSKNVSVEPVTVEIEY